MTTATTGRPMAGTNAAENASSPTPPAAEPVMAATIPEVQDTSPTATPGNAPQPAAAQSIDGDMAAVPPSNKQRGKTSPPAAQGTPTASEAAPQRPAADKPRRTDAFSGRARNARRSSNEKRKAAKPRTIWELLYNWRLTLMRLLLAVVLCVAAVLLLRPVAIDYIEEQYSLGAAGKARVLLRGAQEVATEQLIAFATTQQAEQYLCNTTNLDEITGVARFEVEPVEITLATLDEQGILREFECLLDYEQRRYRVFVSASGNEVELLERLDDSK